MRKIFLLVIAAILLSGCGGMDNQAEPVVDELPESSDAVLSDDVESEIDIDLTTMSSTLVYSVVFNMISNPDDYTGQIIKMNGICNVIEGTGKTYYACVIQDATKCCSQGIEFALSDEYSESDYPRVGDRIIVTGTFGTYEENGIIYCTLSNSELKKLLAY